MKEQQDVLHVKDLKTYFFLGKDKVAKAVDGVSFSIKQGETLALVGESGSGKSMTSLSLLKLINKPGKIVEGSISLNGLDLVKCSEKEMEHIRGNEIAMIFQEPMTALNPVFSIGNQISEMIRKHKKVDKKAAKEKTIELLKMVGIPRAEDIFSEYPHQLSGGMRQRVMIAMAISCEPKLLIADEPTTALDVTIQSQILDLLMDLQVKFNMAIILITHDLGVVSEYADRVAVMYGGQIIEEGMTKELLQSSKHPYTQGLINSIPSLKQNTARLDAIPGTIAPAYDFPKGCRFADRCSYVMDICRQSNPTLKEIEQNHLARCYLHEEGGNASNEDSRRNGNRSTLYS